MEAKNIQLEIRLRKIMNVAFFCSLAQNSKPTVLNESMNESTTTETYNGDDHDINSYKLKLLSQMTSSESQHNQSESDSNRYTVSESPNLSD